MARPAAADRSIGFIRIASEIPKRQPTAAEGLCWRVDLNRAINLEADRKRFPELMDFEPGGYLEPIEADNWPEHDEHAIRPIDPAHLQLLSIDPESRQPKASKARSFPHNLRHVLSDDRRELDRRRGPGAGADRPESDRRR